MSSTYAAVTLTLPAASATYRGMAWAVSSAGFGTASGTWYLKGVSVIAGQSGLIGSYLAVYNGTKWYVS